MISSKRRIAGLRNIQLSRVCSRTLVVLSLCFAAGPACLNFECSPIDVVCSPEAMLLYTEPPDCNFAETLNFNSTVGIAQEAYIKSINIDDCDEFSSGLAFDCATQTLVVSSVEEASNATGINGTAFDNSLGGSGAAYIYRYNQETATWFQEAYIKASNTDAADNFGVSVALSGDTLAVGAYQEDSNARGVNSGDAADNSVANSGAVYVFRRGDNGVWSQEAYLKASNSDAGDRFGFRVALEDDLLAVSTILEASNATGVNGDENNNAATNAGAAYVFRRSGASWQQEAYLKASNTEASDGFGRFIGLSGDTLAVGTQAEASNATGVNPDGQSDNSAAGAGAVYVFRNLGSLWYQEAYIKASNTESVDQFGRVALSGNVLVVGADSEDSNGVGVNTATQSDNSTMQSGAAYIFRRGEGGLWSQEAYLKASNTGSSENFGTALSLSGNALAVAAVNEASNATGVGGNQNDNSAGNSGAVYLFQYKNGAWAQSSYVKASNTDGGDSFGNAMSLSGNGLVVGTISETSLSRGINSDQSNNAGTKVGAAYFFR